MSITLKRPMFRKGGEVMEGIMTGIKPRKMFSLGTEDQAIVDDVQRKMRLINAVGGTSPLSDPLTQFLLTAGPDLVEGKAAGGTKLQEIIGGVKPGLQAAVKTQQLKDLSNRKLATALISKSKTPDTRKLYNALKNTINPKTGKLFTFEDVASQKALTDLYKKETSPLERDAQKAKEIRSELGKFKDFLRNPKYSEVEKSLISTALNKIQTNKGLLASIDKQNPYYQGSDYTLGTPEEINNKKVKTLIPEDKDEFTGNKTYFIIEENGFFVFDETKGKLIQLPGV
jgi:hypothetical protein